MICWPEILNLARERSLSNLFSKYDFFFFCQDTPCWTLGDKVEVYSRSRQVWCKGEITFVDYEAKELVVHFFYPGSNQKMMKTLKFDSNELRPIVAVTKNICDLFYIFLMIQFVGIL